jgi:hypothetical protein
MLFLYSETGQETDCLEALWFLKVCFLKNESFQTGHKPFCRLDILFCDDNTIYISYMIKVAFEYV